MATPLDSTEPSDIASAARCFSSCIPDQLSVRSYLLSQVGQVVGPPCVTPSAPTRIVLTHGSPLNPNPGSSTITIGWTEKNSGSFVTGYEVFWGTVSGGPYPNNSGILPSTPHTYTITGLTTGTTYFIVVQAIAFAGCVSPNSAEFSATTTGTTPNGLLNSVISYTPLNDSSVVLGTGAVADQASPGRVFSAPNTAVISGAGTGNINPVADFHTNFIAGNGLQRIQSADPTLNFPANQKFTAIAWVNFSVREAGFSPFYCNWGASGFFMGEDNAGNNIIGLCHDGAGGTHTVTGPAFNTGQWYFVAVGWDGVNFWISVNAGALTTTAVATLQAYTDSLSIGSYPGGGVSTPTNGFIGGCGLWFRSLSATDLTNLYNGGSGLTFNQFTP